MIPRPGPARFLQRRYVLFLITTLCLFVHPAQTSPAALISSYTPSSPPPDPHVLSLPPTHRGTHRAPQVALSTLHTLVALSDALVATLRHSGQPLEILQTLPSLLRRQTAVTDSSGLLRRTHLLHQALGPGWKGTSAS